MLKIIPRTSPAQTNFIHILGLSFLLQLFLPSLAQAALGDQFVFQPRPQSFQDCPHSRSVGTTAVEEEVQGSNSGKIRYYAKTSEGASAWFVYFHGNAGSACDRLPFINALSESGSELNYAFVEYPGYSNDPIRPSEKRVLENALQVYDSIQRRNRDNLPIILYGESLGTAVATYIASRRNVDKLVLHAPFTSILNVARRMFPYLPVGRLMKSRFPSSEWAPQVKGQVLILHGQRDRTIPLSMGERQAKNFTSAQSVKLVKIPQADHNDVLRFSLYWQALREFVFPR